MPVTASRPLNTRGSVKQWEGVRECVCLLISRQTKEIQTTDCVKKNSTSKSSRKQTFSFCSFFFFFFPPPPCPAAEGAARWQSQKNQVKQKKKVVLVFLLSLVPLLKIICNRFCFVGWYGVKRGDDIRHNKMKTFVNPRGETRPSLRWISEEIPKEFSI